LVLKDYVGNNIKDLLLQLYENNDKIKKNKIIIKKLRYEINLMSN